MVSSVSATPHVLQAGSHCLRLDTPQVMGILNLTPDSFSDGGSIDTPETALHEARSMLEAGAVIIDVGAESTRPGAAPVGLEDELDRLIPVVRLLCKELDAIISVDTSKPDVMTAATEAGATMINDVRALREPGALEAVAEAGVPVCLMHMQGTPATMQENPLYRQLPDDIIDFLGARMDACVAAGIHREAILVDPGFGFGKTEAHNLQLLASLERFGDLGAPVLVGLSRKRTLGTLTGRSVDERLPAGVAAAVIAAERGADIVRTHDVAATVDALRIWTAVSAAGGGEIQTP